MNAADDLELWSQRPGEGPKHFHAFCHYRDQGPGRTILRAYRDHLTRCERRQGVPRAYPRRWGYWASGWGWVERAAAFDAHVEQIAREKIAKDQVDARVRHARMAQMSLQTLVIPPRATLEAIQDPKALKRLVQEARESSRGLLKLINLTVWCSKAIPGLVAVERLALGMTTDEIVIEDKRDDGIARRIVQDETATDMAIALLDRIAGTQEQQR